MLVILVLPLQTLANSGREESETFRVHLADAAGQTEFRFKSQFLQMTFPKVNNPTKILNAKIQEKTKTPNNETTFFEKKKKKGERQRHRKEAEEGSTTQKRGRKSFFK